MSAEQTTLAAELAPIQAQIEQEQHRRRSLEAELQIVQTEIESFSGEKQRFDLLRNVSSSLDALGGLGAGDLFWQDLPGDVDVAGHLGRLRDRIARFEDGIRGTQEKHDKLKAELSKLQFRLNHLQEEVRRAYARDARRTEDLLIEREISAVPYHELIMPWSSRDEDEKRFRKSLLYALLFCLVVGALIPLISLPKPDRSEAIVVPERLATLVKQEKAKPLPPPRPVAEAKRTEEVREAATEKTGDGRPKETAAPAAATTTAETKAARRRAESAGVLAFKEGFSDLMSETPSPGLGGGPRVGSAARLSNKSPVAAGSSRASRSLIAMRSPGGSSGGIGNAGISRNIGSGDGSGDGSGGTGGSGGGRLGGVGFARVESSVADLAEEARPLSTGPGPARTDEEIQIVFDKYKAALYRIYNSELRKDPTLRGKMILRITIEPGGEVSACMVQSSDLGSPPLEAQIVERVKRFNFGPKEKVTRVTILYPIDFLPGG